MSPQRSDTGARPQQRVFATTHWTVVLLAKSGRDPAARDAFAQLCESYWPPIYAFLRRSGYNPSDAEDLTQGFFLHLMEKDFLSHLTHRRGKFRSFLLTFLKNFLSDERDKAGALKRGGAFKAISFDALDANVRDELDPKDQLTPEAAYDLRWAQQLLARSWNRLRQEYILRDNSLLFENLQELQPGEHSDESYKMVGERLGLSESALKTAVHRFRRRHREILREEILQTVATPEEVDAEIQNLISIIGCAPTTGWKLF